MLSNKYASLFVGAMTTDACPGVSALFPQAARSSEYERPRLKSALHIYPAAHAFPKYARRHPEHSIPHSELAPNPCKCNTRTPVSLGIPSTLCSSFRLQPLEPTSSGPFLVRIQPLICTNILVAFGGAVIELRARHLDAAHGDDLVLPRNLDPQVLSLNRGIARHLGNPARVFGRGRLVLWSFSLGQKKNT
jgi:hypothetical protein